MNGVFPVVYLSPHCETEWSLYGQHTGRTDLPLTERGERTARRLGERLSELKLAKVFTSPLRRATRTCELAGFGDTALIDPDLVEWDCSGEYEGRPDHAGHPRRTPGLAIIRKTDVRAANRPTT